MASQIEVCNHALTKLGADRLLSLADDNKGARAIAAVYDRLLDAELSRNRWSFAIKRASLPALADAPLWGYEKAYNLPVDCLSLVWVDGAGQALGLSDLLMDSATPYLIEGRKILTDLPAPLRIRYVARVVDPGQWDPSFWDAFAARLAFEICEDVTQAAGKKDALWGEYRASIAQARRVAAIQGAPQVAADDSWLQARL